MAAIGIVGLIGTALSVVVLIICVIAKQRVVLPLILLVLFASTLILSVGFSAGLHLLLFEESDEPDASQIQSDETESDTSEIHNEESGAWEDIYYPGPADILPQPGESASGPSITSNSRDLLYAFIEAGLPLLSVFEYDESTCPDGLLGRPNQYIERIDWRDSRYSEEYESASVEVFNSHQDMLRRKEHIESEWEVTPTLRQHLYYNDTMLLRLPSSFSSSTAAEYESIFNSLR